MLKFAAVALLMIVSTAGAIAETAPDTSPAGKSAATKAGADGMPPTAVKAKLDPALFASVDGVSVRQYAHIVFDLFANGDQSQASTVKLLEKHGLTQDRFNKITEVMTERMRNDNTFKFIDIYGAYYIENAPGPFHHLAKDVANHVLNGAPLKEKPPYSWDEYRAIQGFYARKAPFAKDTTRASYDEILSEKGMNFIDYTVLGSWYGKHLTSR